MKKVLFAALLPFMAAGCISGARTKVVAPNATVPVSMSRGVRDASGELVSPERKQFVGEFSTQTRAWSTFYTLLPFTPKRDISEAINQQVQAAGGDAVINTTIIAKGCSLNRAWPFIFIPIWPGCSKIEIVGDIIKVLPANAVPPAPAAPSYTPAPAPGAAPAAPVVNP